MEENVALDSTKKKKFLKSIKGIKKLIQKNEKKAESEQSFVEEPKEEKKKSKRKPKPERGLVYLSHIPHGFYEHQMTEYFKQFGGVTNVRVIRSKRTGRSKGFAFVEFFEPSVAQIVAETMNNYLMGKRLIKAAYIPPEKQRRLAKRKFWNEVHNPGALNRLKHKKTFNAVKDEQEELKRAKKQLSNLQKTKKKLEEFGINYDFFMPVDIPLNLIKVKEEKEVEDTPEVKAPKAKKDKKIANVTSDDKKTTKEKKPVNNTETVKTVKENKPKPEPKIKGNKAKKETGQVVQIVKIDKKEQEQKQKKLDKAGVKNVQNFIKVQESDNDSDSSAEFDSDEYEKIMADDSDLPSDESEESGDDDDDDDDEDDENDDSESEDESAEDIPPPKPKNKPQSAASVKNAKQQKQQEQASKSALIKRKAPQRAPVTTKKPKFEKQNKPIPMKKQFKKKK